MQPAPKLNGLQVLRGIAALMVVLHHTFEEARGFQVRDLFIPAGAAGVDIFFVISGFIMLYISYPTERREMTPPAFLASRVLRIYPFYWVCMAVVMGLWMIGFYRALQPDADLLVRSALLLPDDRYVIGVAWTLVYEMFFYAVFAIALLAGTRRATLTVATCAVTFSYLMSFVIGSGPVARFFGNAIMFEFCLGMILAELFLNARLPLLLSRWGWVVGFVAIVASALLLPYQQLTSGVGPTRLLAWGLPAFFIASSFVAARNEGLAGWKPAILLGDSSYALYLTHPFVMIGYAWALRHLPALAVNPQIALTPFVVVMCLAVGVGAHLYVEKPLGKRLRSQFAVGRTARARSVTPTGVALHD